VANLFNAFSGCEFLTTVIFGSNSQRREINGFRKCTSLCWIEIPSSVRQISDIAFSTCRSFNEVIFASDCHLEELDGFQICLSLSAIQIPSFVEQISEADFFDERH
jgi:hypothetical protein